MIEVEGPPPAPAGRDDDASGAPEHAAVTEAYLETIYDLEQEGVDPLRARLVERLGVSAPTVSQTVARLEEQGLVTIGDDRVLALTDRGREVAIRVIRKHRLAERLLRDVIGLEWWKIHREAARWEHVISDDVEDRLVDLLGDPGTCPHGNTIPGSVNAPDQSAAVPLASVADGAVRVVRISEELESDDEALRLLEGCGFIPGRAAEVAGRDEQGVKVIGAVTDAVIPPHVAAHTFVELR